MLAGWFVLKSSACWRIPDQAPLWSGQNSDCAFSLQVQVGKLKRKCGHLHQQTPGLWQRKSAVVAVLSIAGGFLFNVPEILSGMFPIEKAAESGGGWLMFARIGMMRALNADERQR